MAKRLCLRNLLYLCDFWDWMCVCVYVCVIIGIKVIMVQACLNHKAIGSETQCTEARVVPPPSHRHGTWRTCYPSWHCRDTRKLYTPWLSPKTQSSLALKTWKLRWASYLPSLVPSLSRMYLIFDLSECRAAPRLLGSMVKYMQVWRRDGGQGYLL